MPQCRDANVGAERRGEARTIPLIEARMAAVLPHVRVDRGVGIDQREVEPAQSVSPVNAEVLDQKASDDVLRASREHTCKRQHTHYAT